MVLCKHLTQRKLLTFSAPCLSGESLELRIPSFSEYAESLRRLSSSIGAEAASIGRSAEGREILAVRLGKGRARVAVVAGQHGSEPAPPLAILRFLETLARDRALLKRVAESCRLMLVPLANPDGFSKLRGCLERCGAPSWRCECADARLLSSGDDMNRDWLLLRNPETRAIHRELNDFDPHIVLDLHEFYAVGGCPPRWAHETEGFDAYVTDAPYAGVSPEIQTISRELAELSARAVRSASGFRVELRRVGVAVPIEPSYLGVHAPLEGCAKVLVETWGVGLGTYLLYERVHAHAQVVTETCLWCATHTELLDKAKAVDRAYDEVCWEHYASDTYVISGEGVEEVSRVMKLHGVPHSIDSGRIVVSKDRKPRYCRIALAMLEPSYIATPGKPLVEDLGVEVSRC